MELTGERTAPGIWHENYWFRRHEVAYLFAAPLAAGQEVLEAGCGEGYGAQTLIAAGAAPRARARLRRRGDRARRADVPAVPVVRANLVALPLPDRCVDLVVSYQVVEHLWDPPAYVAECARALRPEGRLLLSTPNRPMFSPGLGRGETPLNPFHSEEYDADELVGLRRGGGARGRGRPRRAPRRRDHALRAGARTAGRRPARRGRPESWDSDARGLRRRPHGRRLRPARRAASTRPRPAGDRDAPVSHPAETAAPIGSCAIVLHTHLPWLAHHGSWPVGEEWLYQSWATSYLPVAAMLRRLADEGRRDLLTLGVTPVLAAQLDDPYCLQEFHTWLGFWSVRAQSMAARRSPEDRATGAYEFAQAQQALADFDDEWRHGASPVLRALSDSGAVELLGGPASHPFQPLLDDRVARFALDTGLDDAAAAAGRAAGGHLGPRVRLPARPRARLRPGRRAALPRRRADAARRRPRHRRGPDRGQHRRGRLRPRPRGHLPGVVPAQGLPGRPLVPRLPHVRPRLRPQARPRHLAQHARPRQGPVRPGPRGGAGPRDAADFVDVVRRRLLHLADQRDGRPGLVVAAYDTELFGHWWHEGPAFLEQVLRLLPEAGVRVTTLRGAIEAGHVEGRVDLGPGSWGSGKDWRVWDGAQVADLVDDNARLQKRWLDAVDDALRPPAARPRPRLGPALARRPARAVQRLGVHGHQGLRRRIRARPRRRAPRALPPPGRCARGATPATRGRWRPCTGPTTAPSRTSTRGRCAGSERVRSALRG